MSKILTSFIQKLIRFNHQDTIFIFKDCYKHIVRKNKYIINNIREETQTRIELPAKESGLITVIGTVRNVKRAVLLLNKIQNDLVYF